MSWYQLDVKETLEKLRISEEGLNDEQVKERLAQYGPNIFAREEKISKLKILLHQFKSPLIYILVIAGLVTLFLHEYIDTGVIMGVVILNAFIGYVQEFRAEESMRALKKMILPKARVLRNRKEREITSEELVPGDVVLIASGGKVPADLRLFRTTELKIEEAPLTGESIPVEKVTSVIKEDNLTPGDQKNMAFMGTTVVSGRGRGAVVETGNRTVLGQIAEEVREVEVAKTPVQDRLERFAKLIGIFVIGFSAVVFGTGIWRGEKISEIFMIAVATAVSAIPEGLPVAVTIAMAVGVARMARGNAIIRKLPAVETLGSTTIICSDKTGTLTKNEMTVRLIYDGEHTYEVTGSGYEPKGEITHEKLPLKAKERINLEQVLRIGLLCNESDIYEENGLYKVDGDPTEGALIVSAMKAGLSPVGERQNHPQLAILPFESERGYMATLHKHEDKKFIFVKGSPEHVLDMCTDCLIEGELKSKQIVNASTFFAQEGLRVLAMGFKEVPPDKEELTHQDVEEGIIYAGLQGMIDPPRPEAITAIEGCRKAGIRTVMITGDHAITAVAIAKRLGIGGDELKVLTGKNLEAMSEEDLFREVSQVPVYARVSPHHKLMITQQLLKQGEVVAVTGDGVNDAPALKAAHIGIAMGKTGTDVAKEASDMVLADDNFATIFSAVEGGRVVYDNVKKVTLFLVSCGFGELIAILSTIAMGLPIPYIAVQILWLNLVTNGLQDVALAFEPGEKGILQRPPRSPKEGILSSLMIQRTLLMGSVLAAGTLFVFITRLEAGMPLEKARTAALTTMVFFQFYQALNCRSETQSIFKMSLTKNPFLLFSMLAAFFAQLAVLYVPALSWIFRTEPITVMGWVEILLVTLTIVIVIELDKWIRRKKRAAVARELELAPVAH
ncbi:MAG: HAD-IC family P-type ATPase [candidate division Zixibacteria bacterium]|nr:HAD-IC family P-type ATPase [candidate division Zixibacteria bacterium]